MSFYKRLLAQSLEDTHWLLDHFSEEEAKPYVLMLIELSQGYRATLQALRDRLEA